MGLLRHDPDQRLSLDDVIEHPWLSIPWRGVFEVPSHGSDSSPAVPKAPLGNSGAQSPLLQLPPPRAAVDDDEDMHESEKDPVALTPKTQTFGDGKRT